MGLSLTSCAAIVAGFALQSFDTFFRDDGGHGEARHWVGPPKTEKGIEQQPVSTMADRLPTKLCMFCVRVHRRASQCAPHLSFSSRQERHYNQRHACQRDPRNAVLGSATQPQIRHRFICDVCRQTKETDADNLESAFLVRR